MEQDRPDILIFPPLAFLLALSGAIALGIWLPLGLMPAFPWRPGMLLGGAVGAFALFSAGSGVAAFRRAGTNVDPREPALTIVRNGAFRYTRNPMYLGMLLLLLGYGIAASNLWGVVMAAALCAVLHFGVVLREERYLEAKFGKDYRVLLTSTRRWL